MSGLPIPEAAVQATYASPMAATTTNKVIRAVLELGAPHIVAAELRRLAAAVTAEIDGWVRDGLRRTVNSGPDSPAYRDLDRTDTRLRYHRDTLLRRADELDGGAR